MYCRKNVRPRIEPQGTPALTGYSCERHPIHMAISSHSRQWRNQKFEVDFSRERKMILQCGFFCSLLFLMFNIMSLLHFSCLSSVKKIIPPASNKRSLVGQLCIY